MRVDTVTYCESAYALAHCYYGARRVADGDQRLGNHVRLIDAIHDRFVAEVQGDRTDLDQQLTGLGGGRFGLTLFQILKTKVLQQPSFHIPTPSNVGAHREVRLCPSWGHCFSPPTMDKEHLKNKIVINAITIEHAHAGAEGIWTPVSRIA
ncbi:hypothetical protein D3C85_1511580 [compost metagenome]